jgi:hypothetical protein
VTEFGLSARSATAITTLITNILFLGVFVSLWIYFIKSGRQTGCVDVGHGQECDWIDGVITPLGMQTIATRAGIQLVINVVTVLVARDFSKSSPDGA